MKEASLMLLTILSLTIVFSSSGRADEGLVLYLPFDEGNGDISKDRSGKGNNAILKDGAAWTKDGKYESAVLLDGVKSAVAVEHSDDLDLDKQYTIEAWVYPHDVAGAYKGIITKEDWDNGKGYYLGQLNQEIYFGFNKGAHEVQTSGKNFATNKQWYHVAGTYDAGLASNNFKIYINGVLVKEGGGSTAPIPHTETLDVGWIHDLVGFFSGIIDEVAIYRRVLTAEEIRDDMDNKVSTAVAASGRVATTWANLKDR